jgi:hypothetical protein
MNFPFRILVLGVGVFTLVLCMGSKEEEAKTNSTNPKPAAQEAATPAPDAKPAPATPAPKPAESTNAATSTNAAALTDVVSVLFSTNVLGQPVLPASLKLSTPLSDVVKLIQAGVGEDVLMAFIAGAADPFDASSDAIIYLHDLGVSSNVITALIQHDASPEMQAKIKTANAVKPLPPGVALGTPATNIYVPKEPVATVQNPPEPQPVNPPGTVSDTASPVPVTGSYTTEEPAEAYDNSNTAISYNYWYSNLAPYGSWVDVGGYGACWRPTVSVCNSAWRPYSNAGRWLWSDSGWYWYSDYSWGWGPFHYGRWACPSGIGWVWMPGNTWGPAWVSWRYTPTYCGWAPLPPAACYYPRSGFYFNTASVGIGCEFGLGASAYVFLPVNRFCDRRPYNYYVGGGHAQTAYQNSTVVNNYIVGNNNTIINNGVGIDRIAQATRGDVRRVALKDTTSIRDLGPRREQLTPDGATLAVHRPDSVAINRQAAIAAVPRPIPAAALVNPRSTGRSRSTPSSHSPATTPPVPGSSSVQPVGTGLAVASLGSDLSPTRRSNPRGGQSSLTTPNPGAPAPTSIRPQPVSAGSPSSGTISLPGSGPGRRDAVSRPKAPGNASTPGSTIGSGNTANTGGRSTPSPIVVRNQDSPRGAANRPVTYPFVPTTESVSASKPAPGSPRSHLQSRANNSAPAAPRSSYVPGPPAGGSRAYYNAPSVPSPAPAPSGGYSQPSYSAPAPSRVESAPQSYSAPSPSYSSGSSSSSSRSSGGGDSGSRGSSGGSASPGSFGPVGRGR